MISDAFILLFVTGDIEQTAETWLTRVSVYGTMRWPCNGSWIWLVSDHFFKCDSLVMFWFEPHYM